MRYLYFLLAVFVCCQSCKENELDTYHENDGIYFARRGASINSTSYADTTTFSFAFAPVPDTVIHISVKGYGEVADHDRTFSVKVEDGNAVEGVCYELLSDQMILRADSVYGSVPVRIYREPTRDTTYNIHLRLLSNENFSTNLPIKINTRDTIDVTHHVLVFSDKLEQPRMWMGLGYWSETKFYYLNAQMGINPFDWFDPVKQNEMYSKAMGMGTFLVNLLNQYVERDDYVNMPKDPLGPRGYMTFDSFSGSTVTIPGTWPDAKDI